jgi:hypothetical protein
MTIETTRKTTHVKLENTFKNMLDEKALKFLDDLMTECKSEAMAVKPDLAIPK